MTPTQREVIEAYMDAVSECGLSQAAGAGTVARLVKAERALLDAMAEPAPVQEPASHFKNACWLRTSFSIGRYLMSNAHGRWNGTEKALYHRELCKFYVAAVRGFDDEGLVDLCGEDFKAVHESTQQLTDRMDEVIGFPLKSMPDYDKLGPLFFDHFHALAMKSLKATQQPAPPADVPMLTDKEVDALANATDEVFLRNGSTTTWHDHYARAVEQTVRQKAGLP